MQLYKTINIFGSMYNFGLCYVITRLIGATCFNKINLYSNNIADCVWRTWNWWLRKSESFLFKKCFKLFQKSITSIIGKKQRGTMGTNYLFVPGLLWKMKVTSSPHSAEQVSAGGPIELMKKALLASHLQLARSLNLWHVLAGIVNKIRLPLQANPALYMSSQLWTCHLFLL